MADDLLAAFVLICNVNACTISLQTKGSRELAPTLFYNVLTLVLTKKSSAHNDSDLRARDSRAKSSACGLGDQ